MPGVSKPPLAPTIKNSQEAQEGNASAVKQVLVTKLGSPTKDFKNASFLKG
jgi:hypothetical protein